MMLTKSDACCLVVQFNNPRQAHNNISTTHNAFIMISGVSNVYINRNHAEFVFIDYNPKIISEQNIISNIEDMGKARGWDLKVSRSYEDDY